ncbi:MAG: hypothetical protein IIY29_06450 [Firmicutes bacterium]|nr:hypothetical protein [Bacillota bacterium]
MTEQEYNQAEGIRRSDLWKMEDSPEKFKYFLEHPEEMNPEYFALIPQWGIREAVKDAIASMTDRQAIRTYEGIFMPHFGD